MDSNEILKEKSSPFERFKKWLTEDKTVNNYKIGKMRQIFSKDTSVTCRM